MFRSLVLASLILTAQPVIAQNQSSNPPINQEQEVVNLNTSDDIIIQNTVEPLIEKNKKIKLVIVHDQPKKEVKKVEATPASIKPEVKNKPVINETKEVSVKKAELKTKETLKKPEVKPEVKKAEAKTEKTPEKSIDETTDKNVKKPTTIILQSNDQVKEKSPETKIATPEAPKKNIALNPDQIKELIKKYSLMYNVSESDLSRIAECESEFKSDLVGSGKYFGVFQFSKNTFNEFASKIDIADPDPLNPGQNIEVAAYMMANGQSWRWGCK